MTDTKITHIRPAVPLSWETGVNITGQDGNEYEITFTVDDDGINFDTLVAGTEVEMQNNPWQANLPDDVWDVLRSLKVAVSRTNTVSIATGK